MPVAGGLSAGDGLALNRLALARNGCGLQVYLLLHYVFTFTTTNSTKISSRTQEILLGVNMCLPVCLSSPSGVFSAARSRSPTRRLSQRALGTWSSPSPNLHTVQPAGGELRAGHQRCTLLSKFLLHFTGDFDRTR